MQYTKHQGITDQPISSTESRRPFGSPEIPQKVVLAKHVGPKG